ncbi:MAG: sensor histidine kinase [Actinomycetota bacterium]
MTDDSTRDGAIGCLDLAGSLAAALAHDLGQPLNLMRLAAELASGPSPDPARIARALATVMDQTGRARAMLDELLAVTVLRHARPKVALAPLPVVRTVLRASLPRLGTAGVRLRWQADPRCPAVLGQAEWLARIVASLVDNARDAMSGAETEGGVLHVWCRRDGPGVRLSVVDSGPGLPPGVAEALAAPRPGRLGLGLTLAAGLAAEMGGRIEAVPVGSGARMDLVLPAAAPASSIM